MKVLLLLLLLFSCTQDSKTPEGALKAFVNLRFSKNFDAKKVITYTTGDLHESLSASDEDELKWKVELKGLSMKSFKIIRKSCHADDHCFITYTLAYLSGSNDDKFSSTVKKIVELKKIETIWKIANINNIKTYHKADGAINALE